MSCLRFNGQKLHLFEGLDSHFGGKTLGKQFIILFRGK